MSVLIKGMKMPKGCLECCFKDIGMSTMTQCMLVAGWVRYKDDGHSIPNECPLVELPEKHGRLVDADDVKTTIKNLESYFDEHLIALLFDEIDKNVPTVIEAEE